MMKRGWRRLRGWYAAVLVALVPVVATAAETEAEVGGGHEGAAHINWWTWDMHAPPVGWFLLDFVVFVVLLVYFTRRPLAGAMATRHEAIKRAIEDNEAAYAAAKAEYDEARTKLAAVEREVSELIARVKEDGAVERDRIVESARGYAVRLREDAKNIIAYEGTAARERLQRAVAERALALATEKLVAAITDADKSRMIDEAIGEIEKVESLAVAAQRRRTAGRSAAGGDAAGGAE